MKKFVLKSGNFKMEVSDSLIHTVKDIASSLSLRSIKLKSVEDYEDCFKKLHLYFFIEKNGKLFLVNNDKSLTETSNIDNYLVYEKEEVVKVEESTSDEADSNQEDSEPKTNRRGSGKKKTS